MASLGRSSRQVCAAAVSHMLLVHTCRASTFLCSSAAVVGGSSGGTEPKQRASCAASLLSLRGRNALKLPKHTSMQRSRWMQDSELLMHPDALAMTASHVTQDVYIAAVSHHAGGTGGARRFRPGLLHANTRARRHQWAAVRLGGELSTTLTRVVACTSLVLCLSCRARCTPNDRVIYRCLAKHTQQLSYTSSRTSVVCACMSHPCAMHVTRQSQTRRLARLVMAESTAGSISAAHHDIHAGVRGVCDRGGQAGSWRLRATGHRLHSLRLCFCRCEAGRSPENGSKMPGHLALVRCIQFRPSVMSEAAMAVCQQQRGGTTDQWQLLQAGRTRGQH